MKNKLYWIGIILILSTIFLIAIGDGNLGEQVNQKLLEAKAFVESDTFTDKTTYTIGETIVLQTKTINTWGSSGWYYKTIVKFDGWADDTINGYLTAGSTNTRTFNIPTSGKSAGSYGISAESWFGSAADFEVAFDKSTLDNLDETNNFIITLVEPTPDPIVTINIDTGGCTVVMDGVTKNLGAAETSTTFQVPPSKTYVVTTSKNGYVTQNNDVQVGTSNMIATIINMETNPVPPVLTFTTANLDSGVLISDGTNSATTDESGSVVFSSLGEGSFTFTATKDGYYATPPEYTITLENNVNPSREFVMTLNPINIIITTNVPSTSVTNNGNTQLTDAVAPYTTTFTSAAEAGILYFTGSKEGYEPLQVSVNVGVIDLAKTITLQETVIVPNPYTIIVTVNDVNNNPLSGVEVTLGGTTETTDTLGQTTHEGIGSLTYLATKSGYYEVTDSINVIGNTEITLSLLEVVQTTSGVGSGGTTSTTLSLNEDGIEQFAVTNTNPTLVLDGEDDKTSPIIIFSGIIILIAGLIFVRSKMN